MVSRAPGAAQTPKLDDFRPAQNSCIKNPGVQVQPRTVPSYLGGAFLRSGRPGGPGKAPKMWGRSPPHFGMVLGAPGAAQTPEIDDFRPAQNSCIKNPGVCTHSLLPKLCFCFCCCSVPLWALFHRLKPSLTVSREPTPFPASLAPEASKSSRNQIL